MSICTHCDEPILNPLFNDQDFAHNEPFCCSGCLTVFNILNYKGLEKYYEIKKQSSLYKRRSPVENKKQQFSYLDQDDFLTDYSFKNLHDTDAMEFYLEGIHCLACLWLIEKLPAYLDDVEMARLDMQRSVVTISLKKNGKFSHVARELNNLGYKPHPMKRNQSSRDLKIREDRQMLLKIGIAGAGAGNIMLYAVSVYAGAQGKYAQWFNTLSIVFAIPVLFYSATPFYKNAWNAIKNKTLSIDIPISMALILGALAGYINLITGVNENFFDSLSALVFLLLLSRYFLNKIQEEGMAVNDLNFFYEGQSVLKQNGLEFIEIHPQFLKAGDVIKISSNQMIPIDGIVLKGESLINNSLLTGESKPEKVRLNSEVFSGTVNLSHDLVVKVKNTKEETRLGKILKQVESGWIQKSPIVDLTNKISKYFIAVVFFLSIMIFAFFTWHGKIQVGIERAFSLLIVTCPCALALATPLTLTRTLARAQKLGIIIKNNEVIEKLSHARSVSFDKTGTLTYGALKVASFDFLADTDDNIFEIINSLEEHSNHPSALALKEFSLQQNIFKKLEVHNYLEVMGSGVSGNINGHFYQIKNGVILKDSICLAKFTMDDHIRHDTKSSIKNLQKLGLKVQMLSGDQNSTAIEIGMKAGIPSMNIFSKLTPENKLAMIEKNPNTIMVGDGANDAMALSRSSVSVAVLGALDITLRSSDIYLTTPGISQIPNLILISRETMKVVKRNLILSLIYNSISAYAAITGLISPLLAAVIMPLSSLTVLTSTLIGTKKLNQYLNLEKDISWKS